MNKKYQIGKHFPTGSEKKIAEIKKAVFESGLVYSNTPSEMLHQAIRENLANLKPENIKEGIQIGPTMGNCKPYIQESVDEETTEKINIIFAEDF